MPPVRRLLVLGRKVRSLRDVAASQAREGELRELLRREEARKLQRQGAEQERVLRENRANPAVRRISLVALAQDAPASERFRQDRREEKPTSLPAVPRQVTRADLAKEDYLTDRTTVHGAGDRMRLADLVRRFPVRDAKVVQATCHTEPNPLVPEVDIRRVDYGLTWTDARQPIVRHTEARIESKRREAAMRQAEAEADRRRAEWAMRQYGPARPAWRALLA